MSDGVSKLSAIGSVLPTGGTESIAQVRVANHIKSLEKDSEKEGREVDKAAGGFEALLLHNMLKSMWETVGSTGMFGEDTNQGQIYRDMFNEALSDEISKGRGIGVKSYLKHELLRRGSASK